MRVLIVERDPSLGQIWRNHIQRLGALVSVAHGQTDGVEALQNTAYDILVLNLDLADGSAMAVADYANYRYPLCKVIFVTSSSFFSDGSIFRYMSNACALIPSTVPPGDMAALVEHHAR
ncbi:response regulator [uncultured Litoreibacter sp.]|uniref:response regulator n=1 Tax=uncultured Litoreibacter sp. TaxID=1392394 RepID=UPI002606D31B|nr:response regulator [uncultured Litoreibacter sp.]